MIGYLLMSHSTNQPTKKPEPSKHAEPVFSDKNFSWQDGRHWFDAGIVLFKQVKNYWYLTCLLLGVLMALVSNIALGMVTVLVVFTSPLITAFIMNACFKVKNNQELSFAVLWQDIAVHLNGLMVLGVLSAVFSVIAHTINTQLLHWFGLPIELTPEMLGHITGGDVLLRAMLSMLTNIPIALALAFSPVLVLLKLISPLTAVKYSVLGVLKSWKAFVSLVLLFLLAVFAVIVLVSLLVGIIMAVMGPSSQILINMMALFVGLTVAGIGLCAQYQAYTEIFYNNPESNEDDDDTEVYAEI